MDITSITKRVRWVEGTSAATKGRTMKRIQAMADAISTQFPEVHRGEQIKLKHLHFIKDAWFDNQGFAPTTIKDYLRAMRLMISAMEKAQHWFGPLKLFQDQKRGGRPAVSRVTRSRSRRIRR